MLMVVTVNNCYENTNNEIYVHVATSEDYQIKMWDL